jgi:hypothetical protein
MQEMVYHVECWVVPAPSENGIQFPEGRAMTDWSRIPSTLRRFDAKPDSRSPEAVITQITWSCLVYLQSLPPLLGVPEGLPWDLGKQGCGDLSGFTEDNTAGAHIEIKSNHAAVNPGSVCRQKCGEYLTQFHHMAHDEHAVILAFTHTRRVPKLAEELEFYGLEGRVQVRSFAQLADAIGQALLTDGSPQVDLLSCLLDVEEAA